MVRKPIFWALLAITLIFLMSFLASRRFYFSNEEKKADLRMRQILSALEGNDKDMLKSLFSRRAIDESVDIDGEIDYLFRFFQGSVDMWKLEKWTSGGQIEGHKKSLKIVSWYIVSTDSGDYIFFIVDYPSDTIQPDNKGVYTLRVIKEDRRAQFPQYWQEMEHPGIYVPQEKDE